METNVPEELRVNMPWILWLNQQETPETKPVKLPVNPHNGQLASVSNSATWAGFELCYSLKHKATGLGIVLHSNCGYTCIDLDATDDPEEQARQQAIIKAFNSYTEYSQSTKGYHVWIRATVPSGRRRGKVEMYSEGRYMATTGNVYLNVPIRECQELAMQLWNEMEVKEKVESSIDKPQTVDDNTILTWASQAANGQKFMDLFDGKWQAYYDDDPKKVSCNEADFALINMLAFYTQSRNQIVRLFHSSALGKREKAKRTQYLNYMLNRAFDLMPPEIDLDGLRNNLEQQLSAKLAAKTQQEATESINEQRLSLPPVVNTSSPQTKHSTSNISKYSNMQNFEYSLPPGLMGEIASFIYQSAPRPVKEIAIAGAIGLMSGICGRSYNISGTGLNSYILILACTGAGKEGVASGIDRLMTSTLKTVPAASAFIGPGEIASPQALQKFLAKSSNCFMSLVGEFGMKFRQLCSERASTNEIGLKRIFLDLYNKSGRSSILKPLIYSDKDKNTEAIQAPAFSMLGETTPETFYENLNQQLISDGLLPRFTIIEYHGNRPQLNDNHLNVVPSQQLSDQFAALCAYSLQLNNGNNVLDVQIESEALKLFKDFDKHCDSQINNANNDVTRQLWNRAHIKSLKLAALLAVGCNYINPTVNVECATWALQLIVNDVTNLLTRFDSGEIGASNVQNDQTIEIHKAFKKYVTSEWEKLAKMPGTSLQTHNLKIVPHSFITAHCRQKACFKNDRLGPVIAIKNCLTSMIDCGDIVELSPQIKKEKGMQSMAKLYVIAGMKL